MPAGYLFWTDWEAAAPRIERASLAGRRRRALLRVGEWPNGLALDLPARRVYWVDARADSVHAADYDGGDARVVLRRHPALAHPFAVAVFESHVYWTDWRTNSVVRANKWNGTGVAVVQRTLTQPFDVKIVHPSRQPPAATNPCANNGNCSHLCLIDSAAERVCACPHLMRLAADGVTCEGSYCGPERGAAPLARRLKRRLSQCTSAPSWWGARARSAACRPSCPPRTRCPRCRARSSPRPPRCSTSPTSTPFSGPIPM